jgi:hypothetical protein
MTNPFRDQEKFFGDEFEDEEDEVEEDEVEDKAKDKQIILYQRNNIESILFLIFLN